MNDPKPNLTDVLDKWIEEVRTDNPAPGSDEE